MQNGLRIKEHSVNIDTRRYMGDAEYGILSAYCIETEEVVSIS
jgi:hypothetical protein